MKSIVLRGEKVLARIYFCTRHTGKITSKEQFIKDITSDISDSVTGYAGFYNKKYLRDYLLTILFDNDDSVANLPRVKLNQNKVLTVIGDVLRKMESKLTSHQVKIYIFPSFSAFVREKMGGTSGRAPWVRTILLFIDPTTNWKRSLEETVAHEYVHTLSLQEHKWSTLEDSIIFEGLAENFVQYLYKYKRPISPWSSSLSRKDAKKYFRKMKKKLHSKDFSVYMGVFFGDKDYPLWTGYAVGYNLVKEYIEKHKNTSWLEFIKTKPSRIIKESPFMK